MVDVAHALGHARRHHGAAGQHAVPVPDLHPVVVGDPDRRCVFDRQPHHRAAAEEREHHGVLLVVRVDGPLGVGREVAQRDGVVSEVEGLGVALGRVQRRPPDGELLAQFRQPLVIQEEVHAAGECVPGLQALDVDGEGAVLPVAGLVARPLRARERLLRPGLHVRPADARVALPLDEIGEGQADALLHSREAFVRQPAVRGAGQRKDRLGGVFGALQGGTAVARAAPDEAVGGAQPGDLFDWAPGDALGAHAERLDERAQAGELVVNGAEVALDHGQGRHGLARHGLDVAGPPVLDLAEGLRRLSGRVVSERRGHEAAAHAQPVRREPREHARQVAERVPVRARLPRRVDGRVERVHERVQVGARQVALLVPGGGRQHHVAELPGARHPEVDGDEQVELADGRLITPHHVLGAQLRRGLRSQHVIQVRPHEMAQEVLVAFAGAAQEVGPPDEEEAGEVGGVVGVFDAEAQAAAAECVHDVVTRAHAGGLRLRGKLQWVAVEGRVGHLPAEPLSLGQRIDGRLAAQQTASQRRGQVVGPEDLIAPLVGGQVVPLRAAVLPRGATPVQGRGQRRPARQGTHLLLPHVVGPAAAVAPHAAAGEQQRHDRAVGHVGVEPVVDARAHDDHGPTFGHFRVACELAGDTCGDRRGDAREPLLPGGRVGLAGVVVACRPVAGQARPGDAVLGQEQVEHGGDQPAADAQRRDAAPQHVGLRPVEARQEHLDRLAAGRQERERRVDVAEIQVPVAFSRRRPAVAHRPVGHGRLPCRGVEDDRLPLRRLHLPPEVVGRQETVRCVAAFVLAQRDQERHVRVRLGVACEERHLAVDVELLEDDVAHGEREGSVHARRHRQPVVGELHVLGVIGGHDHDLLAGVARLHHEVRVRRARDGHVAAPDHEVGRVPPVRGLGHVGLVAEHLGRGRRQVGVPVVEGVLHASCERHVPRPRGVRDGRHGRDRTDARDTVGSPALDRVDVRRRAELERFLPGGAHEPAVPARVLVGASYLMIWGSNVPVTRTPDAHFMVEARYAGQKVVVVSPDYAEHVKFADDWLPVTAGMDGALALAMGHVVFKEFYVDREVPFFTRYANTYTDMPFLVTLREHEGSYTPDRFLTAHDLGRQVEAAEWKTVVFDAATGQPAVPNGSMGYRWSPSGEGHWNLDLGDIDPALTLLASGGEPVEVLLPRFDGPQADVLRRGVPALRVGGRLVTTVFDLLLAQYGVARPGLPGDWPAGYDDAGQPYTPAWQERLTGIPAAVAARVAREFARNAEVTEGRSMILMGAGINHWFNSDMTYRTIMTLLFACGCVGRNGGGWAHYVGQEKVRPLTGWATLASALDWSRPPRQNCGTEWYYLATDQWRYEVYGACLL